MTEGGASRTPPPPCGPLLRFFMNEVPLWCKHCTGRGPALLSKLSVWSGSLLYSVFPMQACITLQAFSRVRLPSLFRQPSLSTDSPFLPSCVNLQPHSTFNPIHLERPPSYIASFKNACKATHRPLTEPKKEKAGKALANDAGRDLSTAPSAGDSARGTVKPRLVHPATSCLHF